MYESQELIAYFLFYAQKKPGARNFEIEVQRAYSLRRLPAGAGSFRFLIALVDPAIPSQSGQTILPEA